jgi:hypothetical protein
MPWNIIALPVIICLIWGFKKGIQLKSNAGFKRPFDL